MKAMKNITAFLLALLFLFSPIFVFPFTTEGFAESAPVFTTTVSAKKVKRGEEITVTVMVDNAIKTQGFGLDYSTAYSCFEYVKGTWSDGIRKNSSTVMASARAEGQAVFAAGKEIDVPAGVVFTLNLKAKNDAKFGAYNLEVRLSSKAPDGSKTVAASLEIDHDCVIKNYKSDASYHWGECSVDGCNADFDKKSHEYDHACDVDCNVCGYKRAVTHDYSKKANDATHHWMVCSVCGDVQPNSKTEHKFNTENPTDCGDCGNTESICGDVDGDKILHTDDAVYLLFHCIFPECYRVSQSVDFDGSGKVDTDDVIYLLNYIQSPETYPLH